MRAVMEKVTKYDEWTQLSWEQEEFRAGSPGVYEFELIELNDQDFPPIAEELAERAESWSSEITGGHRELFMWLDPHSFHS